MREVRFYSATVKYRGKFEDLDTYEVFKTAQKITERTDCYDYTEVMKDEDAEKADGAYEVINTYPAQHMCKVYWSYAEEPERTEEERTYDAECEWANMYHDQRED